MSETSLRAIGPASGIYYNTPNEVSMQDLEWEVFYPVAINTPESSDDKTGVGIRNLTEAKMASILHRGPYRKTGSSYEARGKSCLCGAGRQVEHIATRNDRHYSHF